MTNHPDFPDGFPDEFPIQREENSFWGGPISDPFAEPELDLDAAELSRRLHEAVDGVRPTPGTLDYLRKAVPARRKRRAVTASAAAAFALFAAGTATAVGAGVHLPGTQPGGMFNLGSASTDHDHSTQSGGDGSTGPQGERWRQFIPWAKNLPPTAPGTGGTGTAPPAVLPPNACTAANAGTTSMKTTATVSGITYGYVDVVMKSACELVGPPTMSVLASAGNSVSVLRADSKDAPSLPTVATWGRKLNLQPGDEFQIQFAWVPSSCPTTPPTTPPSTVPPTTVPPTTTPPTTTPPTTPPATTGGTGGTPSQTPAASPAVSQGALGTSEGLGANQVVLAANVSPSYQLGYAVSGTVPAATVSLTANCGATVYVTDIYRAGEYQTVPQPSS